VTARTNSDGQGTCSSGLLIGESAKMNNVNICLPLCLLLPIWGGSNFNAGTKSVSSLFILALCLVAKRKMSGWPVGRSEGGRLLVIPPGGIIGYLPNRIVGDSHEGVYGR